MTFKLNKPVYFIIIIITPLMIDINNRININKPINYFF